MIGGEVPVSVSQMSGCEPNALHQDYDIVFAVSALYVKNLTRQKKADHFCKGRDMSGITYQK